MTKRRSLPLGWLIPREGEPGAAVLRRTRLFLTLSLAAANLVGATVVFALGLLLLPTPDVEDTVALRVANAIAFVAYMAFSIVAGTIWGTRRLRVVRDWLRADRSPTPEERAAVLRAPARLAGVHAGLWSLAAVVFGVLNATFSVELGQRVLASILLGGVTTTAVAYLVSERQLRPAAARALAAGVEERPQLPGIRARAFLAWALGTGVPVIGMVMIGLSTLIEHDFNATQLALAVIALAAITLAAGLYISFLAARAVADPVLSVRDALAKVERGDLDAEVPVYDASEMGLLQAGFNRMVAGLRERERIRDLFGRHVGEEVATAALEQEVELGGEVRDVAALFVDVVGSTTLAATRPPEAVVALLNSFFAVVVDVIHEHGGSVNKFEGDAVLAIFGAPVPVEDSPGRALAAARGLAAHLGTKVPELEAAIGVAAGPAVAGNVGAERRFEYTVIGDPVNEAARLTELAKSKPGRILASATTIAAASDGEASRWELGESVTLRGRTEATRLATPR